VIRDVVNLKYTFDERITDGYYCARSLDLFQQMVESPEQLLTPMAPPTDTKMSSQAR
jgi:pyruvate/2-oxoglutarate dehydrogenase complex dihydrolipoamide acyltransferase (E2) component